MGRLWALCLHGLVGMREAITIIVVTDHSEFKEMDVSLLEGKIIYDGRYIFKDLTINNSTVIQPGRGTKSY